MLTRIFLSSAAKTAGALFIMALSPILIRYAAKGTGMIARQARRAGVQVCHHTVRAAQWAGAHLEEDEHGNH